MKLLLTILCLSFLFTTVQGQIHDTPFINSNGGGNSNINFHNHFVIIGEPIVQDHQTEERQGGVGFVYMLPRIRLVVPLPCNLDQFEIFPIPTTGRSTLQIELKQAGQLQISIVNELGQVLQFMRYDLNAGLSQLPLNLTSLINGWYVVILEYAGQFCTRKIVKATP